MPTTPKRRGGRGGGGDGDGDGGGGGAVGVGVGGDKDGGGAGDSSDAGEARVIAGRGGDSPCRRTPYGEQPPLLHKKQSRTNNPAAPTNGAQDRLGNIFYAAVIVRCVRKVQ